MALSSVYSTIKYTTGTVLIATTIYFSILGLIILFPKLQTHVFYLHRVTLTWWKDLNCAEQFGFLHNQVAPFYISTPDGEKLHAWFVVPLGAYLRHENVLSGLDYSSLHREEDDDDDDQGALPRRGLIERLPFRLLCDNRNAKLVLYFHGTAGCLASGWRPDSYRALYSAAPDHIYVVTFDYRGYGLSTGTPSERGLLQDAWAVVDWAINTAGVHPSNIVIYGQSLGTAVVISLLNELAKAKDQSSAVLFAGIVLTATFSDVATLTATYRIGGIIPVLSPLSYAPSLLRFFNSHLTSTWLSKNRIAEFVAANEQRAARIIQQNSAGHSYNITLIHAQDDLNIACEHSYVVFWHALNAAYAADNDGEKISFEKLAQVKGLRKIDLGQGGWSIEYSSRTGGLLRLQMLKYGVHNRLMSYPATAVAVLRAFQATDHSFGS